MILKPFIKFDRFEAVYSKTVLNFVLSHAVNSRKPASYGVYRNDLKLY